MAEWYCMIKGTQYGPVNTQQLRQLAADGRLAPEDLITRDGLKGWVKASSAKGLFGQQIARSDVVKTAISPATDTQDRTTRGKLPNMLKQRILFKAALASVALAGAIAAGLLWMDWTGGDERPDTPASDGGGTHAGRIPSPNQSIAYPVDYITSGPPLGSTMKYHSRDGLVYMVAIIHLHRTGRMHMKDMKLTDSKGKKIFVEGMSQGQLSDLLLYPIFCSGSRELILLGKSTLILSIFKRGGIAGPITFEFEGKKQQLKILTEEDAKQYIRNASPASK